MQGVKCVITSVIATAMLILSAVTTASVATAADIYENKPLYEPQVQEVVTADTKWTEVWLGASIGYGQSHREVDVNQKQRQEVGPPIAVSVFNIDGISSIGPAYTLSGGFNYRIPGTRVIAGVHGGYEWAPGWNTKVSLGDESAKLERGDSFYAGGNLGVLVNDYAHLYGLARWVRERGSELKAEGESFKFGDRDGLGLGLGASIAANERLKFNLEYVHNFFDEDTVFQGDSFGITEKVDEDIIKLGVTYSVF